MIKCNLSVILAERGLKISEISEETGISRTTLTALSYNHGKGVQFDTLNKICKCLDISPGDLFSYIPFDIKITGKKKTDFEPDDYLYDIKVRLHDKIIESHCIVTIKRNNEDKPQIHIGFRPDLYIKLSIIPKSYIEEELNESVSKVIMGDDELFDIFLQRLSEDNKL